MLNKRILDSSYDEIGDVLYVHIEKRRKFKNVEKADGLFLRSDPSTGEPIGATVIDYMEYWRKRQDALAQYLAEFFHIPLKDAEEVLKRANERAREKRD